MDKFNRNYRLLVDENSVTEGNPAIFAQIPKIEVKLPFTMEFDITRNDFSSSNVASIRVYNLSKNRRDQIRKDVSNYNEIKNVVLLAGYNDNIATIFSGQISQAWSFREGTNFITQIECYDAGPAFVNAQTSTQYPEGTRQSSIIEDLIGSLEKYGISKGRIGDISTVQLTKGNTYSGSTLDILRELTGGALYIDNGKANVLGNNETLNGTIQIINSASGLLGTPKREALIVTLEILFEPRIIMGQLLKVESITGDKDINGSYKVVGLHHKGVISDSICGDAITSLRLQKSNGFVEVQ